MQGFSTVTNMPDWLFWGIPVLVYLLLTGWALFNVVNSPSRLNQKVLWVALLILFPLLGLFNWAWIGPRRAPVKPADRNARP